ncbi:hypothetical protein AAVH_17723 [Aphelenchoides avenae]|nr:hypothetical protein AAVH_17723 [Aphelenchus avenae]
MFTAPFVHLLLLLCRRHSTCAAYTQTDDASGTQGIEEQPSSLVKRHVTVDIKAAKLTTRPLNYYIIANGKHAVLQNKSLEVQTSSARKLEVQFREAVPPFAIKNRGSILLLHNKTGSSIDWHRGYPSVQQMLAASGHTVTAPDMPKPATSSEQTVLLTQLLSERNLTRLTIVSSGDGVQQAVDLERKLRATGTIDLHAIVLIDPCCAHLLRKVPDDIPLVVIGASNPKLTRDNFQYVDLVQPLADEQRDKLLQVFQNLLDFIHPR